MKTLGKILALLVTVFMFSADAFAYKYVGSEITDGGTQEDDTRAAACAPATGLRQMEYNNVRALIETGGSLWQDRANSSASYVVPAEGEVSVLYAGSLWLGGLSPDQQLKLAAIRFRTEGNDFWPGPLTVDGAAEKLQIQINRYKGKRRRKLEKAQIHAVAIAELEAYSDATAPVAEEEEAFFDGQIVRRKQIAMTPMNEDEAVDQMELLGHDFFVFFNARAAGINVLYRRTDGNYGLLEPELV